MTLGADGVVAVELQERPVNSMLTHAVEFIAIGTAVRRGAGHDATWRRFDPELQLTLDDAADNVLQERIGPAPVCPRPPTSAPTAVGERATCRRDR